MRREMLDSYYKDVIRKSLKPLRPLSTYQMRKVIRERIEAHQSDTAHMQGLIRRLTKCGYIVNVGRGQYELTELGRAWCGADSVTNR